MVTTNATRQTSVLGEDRIRALGSYLTKAEQRELMNGTVTQKDLAAAEAAISRIKAAKRENDGDAMKVAEQLVSEIKARVAQQPATPPGAVKTAGDNSRNAREP